MLVHLQVYKLTLLNNRTPIGECCNMTEIIDFIAYVVRKTFWSFAIFTGFLALAVKFATKFIFWRICDLTGLFFHLFACCTLIRLPAMITLYTAEPPRTSWPNARWFGLFQTCILLLDIPVAVMALCVFASVIRVRSMLEELMSDRVITDMKNKWRNDCFTGLLVRRVICKHFGLVFVDVMRFLCETLKDIYALANTGTCKVARVAWDLFTSVVMCVSDSLRQVYVALNRSVWRVFACFQRLCIMLLERFLDFVAVSFTVVAICTIARIPAVLSFFTREPDIRRRWRKFGFFQTLLFVLDIPVILVGLFVLLTGIRVPQLVADIRQRHVLHDISESWKNNYYTGTTFRALIIKHFFGVFIDACCLALGGVCLMSWRSGILRRRYVSAEGEGLKHGVIVAQFLQLLLDVPLIICMGIVCCTWRMPIVWSEVNHRLAASPEMGWDHVRYVGAENIPLLLLDIPCIVAFILTMLTWRAPFLLAHVRNCDIFDYHAQTKLRLASLEHFCYLIIDIPCILAFGITMVSWRAPIVWRYVRSRSWFNTDDQANIRAACLQHLFGLIADVPFVAAFAVSMLSWRAPILIWLLRGQNIHTRQGRRTIRGICGTQLAYLFVDIPVVVLCIPVLASMWRLPQLIFGIRSVLGKPFTERTLRAREWEIRRLCLKEFLLVFVDIGSFCLGLVVFLTVWRAVPLLQDCKKKYAEFETKRDELVSADRNRTEITTEEHNSSVNGLVQDEWKKFMWKARGCCLFHFGMLLVDITAMPFFVMILITGLRTSKLISSLLGGQFYTMFCITVCIEFLRLLRDIFYMGVFALLFLLRPVDSWVHLLEDDRHKENRLVREILLWVPDICCERLNLYDELDDFLTFHLKQKTEQVALRGKLEIMLDEHLKRMLTLLTKLKELEMEEGELASLLNRLIFYERKRVTKLMRRHFVESTYMNHCNPDVHAWNLVSYREEMDIYENEVSDAYTALGQYQPEEVPLYTTKYGWRVRSEEETRRVIIDCLPRGGFIVSGMALVCLLFVYRAPEMVKQLRKRFYDRYTIVTSTLREYYLDFLALLHMVFVLAFLYRAPMLLADVLDCLIGKRSWSAARLVVRTYPPKMLADFSHMLRLLFSWKNPRYVFTMLLFGALMPAELFLGVMKIMVRNKSVTYMLALLMYAVFVVLPYGLIEYGIIHVLAYDVEMGWVVGAGVSALIVLLLVQLLVMILSMVYDADKNFLLAMPRCDYVRLNWHNIHAILFEIVEYLQMLALVFKIVDIPMYGALEMRSIASAVFLFSVPYEALVRLTAVIFLLWFFLCGCPQIFELILESYPVGTIARHSSWRLAVSFMSNTLFVTLIGCMSSSIACQYRPCADAESLTSSAGCGGYFLVDFPDVACWNRSHVDRCKFTLVALTWYITTSIIFGTQYGDPDNKQLDIGFSPLYNMVVNIFKAGMLVVVTFNPELPHIVLPSLMVGYILCCNYTVNFRWLFDTDPSNLSVAIVFRLCTFVSCILATISVAIAFLLNDHESTVPLLMFAVGSVLTFAVFVVHSLKSIHDATTPSHQHRELFKEEIMMLESRLFTGKYMHRTWERDRTTWCRLVATVRIASKDTTEAVMNGTDDASCPIRVQHLEKVGQNLLLLLEQNIRFDAYAYAGLAQRDAWLARLASSCDWFQLLCHLRKLNNRLDATFNEPSASAVRPSENTTGQSDDHVLQFDEQDNVQPPPQFVRKTPEQIARESDEMRSNFLDFICDKLTVRYGRDGRDGEHYRELFDKLLPTGPVFKKFTATDYRFDVRFHYASTGRITECEPPGLQMAVGAYINIGKRLCGSALSSNGIFFTNGYGPIGEKGPIGVSVNMIKICAEERGDVYLYVNGRRVKYDVAMASCKTVAWNY